MISHHATYSLKRTSLYLWQWSSARPHSAAKNDLLVTVAPLLEMVGDWRFLLEEADEGDTSSTRYYKVDDALTTSAGKTVRARDIIFTESEVVMNSADAIRLKGGFNDGFRTQTGYATIDGVLKIQKGTLRVERIKIR